MTTGDSSSEHDPLLDAEALVSVELMGLLPTPEDVLDALGADDQVFETPPLGPSARILFRHMTFQASSEADIGFELGDDLSIFLEDGRLRVQVARPSALIEPVGVELRVDLDGWIFRFPFPVLSADENWVFADLGAPDDLNVLLEPVRSARSAAPEAPVEVRVLIIGRHDGARDAG